MMSWTSLEKANELSNGTGITDDIESNDSIWRIHKSAFAMATDGMLAAY